MISDSNFWLIAAMICILAIMIIGCQLLVLKVDKRIRKIERLLFPVKHGEDDYNDVDDASS